MLCCGKFFYHGIIINVCHVITVWELLVVHCILGKIICLLKMTW